MHEFIKYLVDLFALPTRVREIMATQQEVLDKLSAVGSALDNVAGDIVTVKGQLADAIAGQDAAVQAAFQPVSDSLDALVTKAQALADATPDPDAPVPAPVDPPADEDNTTEPTDDTTDGSFSSNWR